MPTLCSGRSQPISEWQWDPARRCKAQDITHAHPPNTRKRQCETKCTMWKGKDTAWPCSPANHPPLQQKWHQLVHYGGAHHIATRTTIGRNCPSQGEQTTTARTNATSSHYPLLLLRNSNLNTNKNETRTSAICRQPVLQIPAQYPPTPPGADKCTHRRASLSLPLVVLPVHKVPWELLPRARNGQSPVARATRHGVLKSTSETCGVNRTRIEPQCISETLPSSRLSQNLFIICFDRNSPQPLV